MNNTKNYTIYFLYNEGAEIFTDKALLPSIPQRFAVVENTAVHGEGNKHRLLCICEGDTALHFLALLGLGGEIKVNGSPAYYTINDFVKLARDTMEVPQELKLPQE